MGLSIFYARLIGRENSMLREAHGEGRGKTEECVILQVKNHSRLNFLFTAAL